MLINIFKIKRIILERSVTYIKPISPASKKLNLFEMKPNVLYIQHQNQNNTTVYKNRDTIFIMKYFIRKLCLVLGLWRPLRC